MEPVHTESYKGYRIEIIQDHDPMSPDENMDTEMFIVYDHRSFTVSRKGFDPASIWETCFEPTGKKLVFKGYHVFKLFALIHTGTTLYLSKEEAARYDPTGFDISMKGFVMIKRQKGSYNRNQAFKYAEALVKEWNYFLSGDVYGYDIPEIKESCWGYYGEHTYALKEARKTIDYHIGQTRSSNGQSVFNSGAVTAP